MSIPAKPVLEVLSRGAGIQFFQCLLDPPVKSDAELREESLGPEDDEL